MLRSVLCCLLAPTFAAAFVAPRPGLLPQPSEHRMACTAPVVVEGVVTGDRVCVTHRWHVEPGFEVEDEIVVPALAGMPLAPGALGVLGGRAAPIRPDAAMLFLAKDEQGIWAPLHLHGLAARGVLWFEKDEVWGYSQVLNPGPYELATFRIRRLAGALRELVPATPAGVRANVAAALVARARWSQTMAIVDLEQRAKAMTAWISPATSPDGGYWSERLWPDLYRACEELGEAAAKPLARVVQVDADAEAVRAAATALERLGGRGRAATPGLIARLRDPRGATALPLVRALRAAADPRAADVLRDCVRAADPWTVAEAALALRDVGDAGAAALLEARVPTAVDDEHPVGAVAVLLEALHTLDPDRAERVVRQRFLDCESLTMQRSWMRALREGRR